MSPAEGSAAEGSAELSVQIDPKGNLVIQGLDRAALERLKERLDGVSAFNTAAAAPPLPKLRIEAIFG